MKRMASQLALTVLLGVLLTVLATLQYRWLGQVSDAEREQLRGALRTRATELSRDFDRELTRTYLPFNLEGDAFDRDPAGALADAAARAAAASSVGGIIRAVYLVDPRSGSGARLRQLDVVARTLESIEWPASLDKWRRHFEAAAASPKGIVPPLIMGPLDIGAPALVAPIPALRRIQNGRGVALLPDPGSSRFVIVLLDEARLTRELLSALVTRHFGAPDSSEYVVAVVHREDPSRIVYAAGREAVTAANADFRMGFFDLAGVESERPGTPGPAVRDHVAITIVRRAGPADPAHVMISSGEMPGLWQLLVRRKSGSLDTVVARSRRRNLAISLGVLGLLGVSFMFVVLSARRQQRLAKQQMEFVAAVSHELRTPLTVIRSAGANLADGVVSDGEQVRKYGALVATEGRRLTDLVERVMTFAGLSTSSSGPPLIPVPVDVSRVVREASEMSAAEAHDRRVELVVQDADPGLIVAADRDALRSALENVIGNAIKYSVGGGQVKVDVVRNDGHVRITVADRGIGIDRDELSQIFQPFVRGRRAIDAQIRGAGIGLSVVKRVVDAHNGEVRAESDPGEGTRVTIELPLA